MADVTVVSTANAAMEDKPIYIQPTGSDPKIGYTANLTRKLLDASTGFGFPQGNFPLSVVGTTLTVGAGTAVIPSATSANGSYIVRSNGNVTVSLSSLSGTGYVFVEARDKFYTGSTYDWQVFVSNSLSSGAAARTASRNAICVGRVSSYVTSRLGAEYMFNTDGDWSTPTFAGNWRGGQYGEPHPMRYRKVNGIVELNGKVEPFDDDGSGTTASGTITTMPVGYRPIQTVDSIARVRSSSGVEGLTNITVTTAGVVTQNSGSINSLSLPAAPYPGVWFMVKYMAA